MPQSMLAFLAMMLATIAALNQYQAQLHTYEQLIHSEFEIMANAVTIEQMELLDLGTNWEDLEDVHGDTTEVTFSVGDLNVSFDLAFAVQFVDENGDPSGSPTSIKEVQIKAYHDKFTLPMVTHTRLFAE